MQKRSVGAIRAAGGDVVTLYADDLDDKGQLDELLVEGIVSFSVDEQCWIAAIDWAATQHTSE